MAIRRTFALLTAGTAMACWSIPALAQADPAAPTDETAADSTADATADDQSTQAADTGGIPDMIVTAQRRGQNMQKVPIAVNAANADTLETLGLRSTSDLGTIAPAVTFATGLGGGAPTVRGVGGTGAGTDESANALYIDGVYLPTPQSMVFQFNNIERVEVLKGPQGTLFGRNASGGLIQIITKTPGHEPEGSFEVGFSNYDTIRATASLSGGLSDTLAVSLSGVFEDQGDGWGQNFTTGEDAYKGRFYGGHAKLVWEVGPDTRMTASALYAYSRPSGVQGGQILPGERIFGGGAALGFFDQTMNTRSITSNVDRNYALTIKHDFDFATFTSISSRDVSESRLVADADLGPQNRTIVDLKGPKRSWTQEFQLASPSSSAVQWLVGAFYYRGAWWQDPSRTRGTSVAPLEFRQNISRQLTNSYALYGQTTVPVTDTTNVTVGLRYTIDKRQHDVTTSTSNPATAPVVFPTERTQDKKLTWRFAVDQQLGERVLAYGSFSRGFKSGLYNIGNPGNPPVRPQTIDAYEIGLKSDLFDRRVRLNLSAFRYEISDIQLRTTVPPNPTPIFYNAAKSRINGADADLTVFVNEHFSLRANAAYLSGKYTSFPSAVFFTVNAAPGFGLTTVANSNATGNETVFTPHWVTNLSGQYEIPSSIGTFKIGATWTYNSGFFFDPQNRTANPSYHMVNGTLTWEPKEGQYVRLQVNNLFDERYFTTIQPSAFGDLYFPGAPRTYGIALGVEF